MFNLNNRVLFEKLLVTKKLNVMILFDNLNMRNIYDRKKD